MRIENKSAYFQTGRLTQIAEFAARYTQYSALATVRFTDGADGHKLTGGYAYKQRPDVSELSLVAPSLVKIILGRGRKYPRGTSHVDSLGIIKLESWDEEVLFVLAHELRHIDQFWSMTFTDEDAAELDAERFAIKVLKTWRRSVVTQLQAVA